MGLMAGSKFEFCIIMILISDSILFQEKLRREKEREEALSKSKQFRQEKMKILNRRTKKGQPKLDQQVEFLLKKIEKSVAPKTDQQRKIGKSKR